MPMPPPTIAVLSWNVNGLRAAASKGFGDWLRKSRAEIVGVQEVRALPWKAPSPAGGARAGGPPAN